MRRFEAEEITFEEENGGLNFFSSGKGHIGNEELEELRDFLSRMIAKNDPYTVNKES